MAFLWLLSGITSLFWGRPIGEAVLYSAELSSAQVDVFIYGGSLLDIALAIWLLLGWHLRSCYKLQLAVILVYSLLLTVMAPSLWLHPFGPLSKNVPLLALLYLSLLLMKEHSHE